MKRLFIAIAFLLSQMVLATEPPAGYPIVNGLIRKIDTAANRISVKHDEIPNLNMPGMTMSFVVAEPEQLSGLNVGDQIHFVADEIDGEMVILWLEKALPAEIGRSNIRCQGVATSTPKTNVEIEIRTDKFSTIRYEFAEGALKGTAYVNSLGHMNHQRHGELSIYRSVAGKYESKLIFTIVNDEILDALFSHFSAGMDNVPVKCSWES